ncbi:MAG TPA: M20/M25/M40 family metallo-hydrolase [Thermodesulfobacteriota bacterium]|nr:M20/M25/M40 family metallo-hydrolase [Thermodesulfobacteriota bacterium]
MKDRKEETVSIGGHSDFPTNRFKIISITRGVIHFIEGGSSAMGLKKFSFMGIFGLVCVALLGHTCPAQTSPYTLSPDVKEGYTRLDSHPVIKKGLAFLKEDHENTVVEQKQICAIPAPPFKEQARAEHYRKRLAALGLKEVRMDKEGNVFGFRRGKGKGPVLLVAAHLDTVFPEGTDTRVREKGGKLYAPGIADDGRGLAALLSVVRALNETGMKTVGDIIFCGNVGEEGLGDLRGVKALFRDHKNIDGFISIDGHGSEIITFLATGSRRYEIIYQGPGGHSFSAFGLPSATHALGRGIAKIADLQTPKEPKTTFTVGTVQGGTSVNSIAAEAGMQMDMRSNRKKELLELEERFLEIVKKAAEEENARWGSDKITVQIKLVGDRPAGTQPPNAKIVQVAWASTEAVGQKPQLGEPSSTDSNLPISLGIPAITIGGGGDSGNNHAPGEWFDPTNAFLGPQRIFLTILGLVGVEGASEPLLAIQK